MFSLFRQETLHRVLLGHFWPVVGAKTAHGRLRRENWHWNTVLNQSRQKTFFVTLKQIDNKDPRNAKVVPLRETIHFSHSALKVVFPRYLFLTLLDFHRCRWTSYSSETLSSKHQARFVARFYLWIPGYFWDCWISSRSFHLDPSTMTRTFRHPFAAKNETQQMARRGRTEG